MQILSFATTKRAYFLIRGSLYLFSFLLRGPAGVGGRGVVVVVATTTTKAGNSIHYYYSYYCYYQLVLVIPAFDCNPSMEVHAITTTTTSRSRRLVVVVLTSWVIVSLLEVSVIGPSMVGKRKSQWLLLYCSAS